MKVIWNDPVRVCEFVARLTQLGEVPADRAIGVERNGKLTAGVVYDHYNAANICMHIAALPGRRSFNREFLWIIFDYPFNQLHVKRVTGIVPASNPDAVNFAKGLKGIKLEATLTDAHPDGDMLIYCMFKEKCTYLGINDGKK